MATYIDKINYVPHDFNTTTITIAGEHRAEGVDSLEVEMDVDETTTQSVADGVAIFNLDPRRHGVVRLNVLEASSTNGYLWQLQAAGNAFKFSVLDTASPDLNVKASYMRIQKRPMINRAGTHAVVEWVLTSTYLDAVGGSYSLAAA